jgi:hypothetical protein
MVLNCSISFRTMCIVAGLWGCAYHPDDFKRPISDGQNQSVAATPPAPPVPEGEQLYQMLYADEFGEEARALGQRARMLAWLHGAGLDESQLRALIPLAASVDAAVVEDEAERSALGPKELEAYGETYRSLIQAFSGQQALSAEDMARHADALREARTAMWGETDPHRARFARVGTVLGQIQGWVNSLSKEQQSRLAEVRFFLRRPLAPLARPGHYESMLAGSWDVGDFDTLRYAGRSPSEAGMNIGGLFAAEAYRVRPNTHLTALQVQALMARALLEPGLVEAIEVVLGEREPLAF